MKRYNNFSKIVIFSLVILLSIISLPSISAISDSNPVSTVGNTLWDLMQQEYSVYFITFLLFFILLYSIFLAAIGKVSVFKQGSGPNKYGKVVAGAFSALATVGIFAFAEGQGGVRGMMETLLMPFGIYGGLGLALVTFMIVFFGLKDQEDSRSWKIAMASAGLALVGFGTWVSRPNIMWLGWLIAFLALLGWLIAGVWGSSPSFGARPARAGTTSPTAHGPGATPGAGPGATPPRPTPPTTPATPPPTTPGAAPGGPGPRIISMSRLGPNHIAIEWESVPGASYYEVWHYNPTTGNFEPAP